MAQTLYNVFVQHEGAEPYKLRLNGTTKLTLAQAEWAWREFKKGRWVGYRKRPAPAAKPRPLTMGERAWREAGRLLGVMEQGGNNRGPSTGGRPGVSEIIRENGGEIGEAWCGDFVAHCYRVAGSKAVQRAWAAVRFLGRLAGMVITGKRGMKVGDIVVFDFPGGEPEDHTGLFGYYCDELGQPMSRKTASHAKCREGNTGSPGGVRETIRPLAQIRRGVRVTK